MDQSMLHADTERAGPLSRSESFFSATESQSCLWTNLMQTVKLLRELKQTPFVRL